MKKLSRLSIIVTILAMLVVPLPVIAQSGGPFTSGFQLQNLSGSTANITIAYYNQDGTTAASVGDTISGNSNKTYFPLSSVPSGFNGSVVVSSDQPLAAITNILINTTGNPGGAAYSGFTAGATTVSLPLILKNHFGISTWFNVQNTGNSATTVNVTYAGSPAPAGGCPESQVIQPGAAKTFTQSTNSCLQDPAGNAGFVGAATLTSAQPIVVTVIQVQTGTNMLLAYNGFTSSSTTLVMPSVSSNFFNSGTGISIQNTGGSSTDVTLTYTPSAGFPGATCTETRTIAPGSSGNYGFPQLPAGCGTAGSGVTDSVNLGFVGSAQVTANSANMPLVAIVNIVARGRGNSAAYNAVNPANATSNISMPLVMDRNYNIFTGVAVANVGNLATNVACTFSGAGAPAPVPSTPLAPGASLTIQQLNQATDPFPGSPAGFVGSATCTASGGDAKIAGIVNELTQGAPTTTDALLTYEAFNY